MITLQQVAIIEYLVREDRRFKVKDLAVSINIFETSIRRIVHNYLGMNQISARWVPRLVSVRSRL